MYISFDLSSPLRFFQVLFTPLCSCTNGLLATLPWCKRCSSANLMRKEVCLPLSTIPPRSRRTLETASVWGRQWIKSNAGRLAGKRWPTGTERFANFKWLWLRFFIVSTSTWRNIRNFRSYFWTKCKCKLNFEPIFEQTADFGLVLNMKKAIDLVCTQHRGGCPNACIVHKLM